MKKIQGLQAPHGAISSRFILSISDIQPFIGFMLTKKRSTRTYIINLFELLTFESRVCKDSMEENILWIRYSSSCRRKAHVFVWTIFSLLKKATNSCQLWDNDHFKKGSNPIIDIFTKVYKRQLKELQSLREKKTSKWNIEVLNVIGQHYSYAKSVIICLARSFNCIRTKVFIHSLSIF